MIKSQAQKVLAFYQNNPDAIIRTFAHSNIHPCIGGNVESLNILATVLCVDEIDEGIIVQFSKYDSRFLDDMQFSDFMFFKPVDI